MNAAPASARREETVMRKIRAACVSFAEVNVPREILDRKSAEAEKLLSAQGLELLRTAPVTDDPEGRDVARARRELAGQDFDLLIIIMAGWIPTHAVISVIEPWKHKPMLVWGLTGDQQGDRFVTAAPQAGTTALRKPMQDMGYTFKYVVTCRGGEPPVASIMSFAGAARAAALLRDARIGMMGYRDMRLYGTLHDGVSLKARIGPDIEVFEMLEMVQAMERLDPAEVARVAEDVKKRWTFVKPPKPGTVEQNVRLALAVRQKIRERGYEAVSLIDVDGVKKLLQFAPAGVFMMLHEDPDVCTIPENDALGAVTQLMVRYLTGQIGAYLEFYEFLPDGVLMGVPDYVPPQVVDGPVTVMPTAFGQFGEGLLNVSRVKTGRVTLARLACTDGRYQMHLATGTARRPAKWEEAGWTPPAPQLPSLEIALDEPIDEFAQRVLSQHYILSCGDNTTVLRDLCRLLGVDC
jgi:L-fucose isomerase-like protein